MSQYKVSPEVAQRYPYTLPPAVKKGPRPVRHDSNGMEVVLVTTPYTGPSKRTAKKRVSRHTRGHTYKKHVSHKETQKQ